MGSLISWVVEAAQVQLKKLNKKTETKIASILNRIQRVEEQTGELDTQIQEQEDYLEGSRRHIEELEITNKQLQRRMMDLEKKLLPK